MSTIILHNESKNQLNLMESLLKVMKIRFEITKREEVVKLSDFEMELMIVKPEELCLVKK